MAMRKKAKMSLIAAHNMDNCTPESSRYRARKVIALARDKVHDSIKISDAGKAYLPRREMAAARTAFFAKRLWPWQLNARISPRPAAEQRHSRHAAGQPARVS